MNLSLLRNMTPSVKIAWKVLSFFASDPDQQISMIGPAEDWFCREDRKRNTGANYLNGMRIAYLEYWGSLFDSVGEDQQTVLKSIHEQLEKMILDKKCWSADALSDDNEWRYLRMLAGKALDMIGLHIMAPSQKPIWFPDIIHIDHWSYKHNPWHIKRRRGRQKEK